MGMTITTDFSVGDTVWFDYHGIDPAEGTIEQIVTVTHGTGREIRYTICVKGGGTTTLIEDKLFPTITECLFSKSAHFEGIAKGLRKQAEQILAKTSTHS